MSRNDHPNNIALKTAANGPVAITRRRFLRYAGISAGAAMLMGPFSAFAAEDVSEKSGEGESSKTAETPGRIEDNFAFGPNNSSDFIFDQGFFNTSSFEYQHCMATFACCLAVASYGVNLDVAEYAKSADNIKPFLEKLSCKDIILNDDFTQPSRHDTLGLACAHRSITVDDGDYELVLMGIRGAFYFLEWGGNALLGREGDHNGFSVAGSKAYDFLKDYVNDKVPTGKPLKILIAGFSRAGAVANWIGGTMARNAAQDGLARSNDAGFSFGGKKHDKDNAYPFPKHEARQCDVYVYGFEVPRVITQTAIEDTGLDIDPFGNIHNIVNPCDLVPKVISEQWGFTRFGSDYVLPCPSDEAYPNARDNMKAFLASINTPAVYPVDSFNQFGMTMDAFFDEVVDKLTNELFISRENYCDTWQQVAIDVLDYVQSGKLAAAKELVSKKSIVNFLLKDVVLPLAGRICYPPFSAGEIIPIAIDLAADRLFKDVLDAACSLLRESGLPWGEDEERLYQEVSAICPALSKFAKDNSILIVAAIKALLTDPQTFKVHNGAICLAWMQSLDHDTYILS